MASSPKKYWRELLKHLPEGYSIEYQRIAADDDNAQGARKLGKHPVVYRPDGTIVRSADGRPVAVAGTPGSPFSAARDLRYIARAGVRVR